MNHKRTHRLFEPSFMLCAAFACTVVVVPGCSQSTSRLSVEGNVTFDGNPLPNGTISFTPLASTLSPTAGATITNGHFSVAQEKGLNPGTFRVEIKAVRDSGKTASDDLSGGKIATKEQYIPARYNFNSELTAEIKAGERNRLEFKLSEK